jgi:antitoxin CptB
LNAFRGESNARRAALRPIGADIGGGDRYISLPGTSGLLAFGRDGQMTGTTRSSNGLNDRRKRLLFRCWHRGTREMDLILGRFADAEIGILADLELTQLEHLIDLPDPDLYSAFAGEAQLAPEYLTPLFDRIKTFRNLDKPA